MTLICAEMEIDEEHELETHLQGLQLEVRSHVTEVDHEPASGSEEDDDDGDLDEEEDEPHLVQVGYVQKPDAPWILARHHFPSKVGGTPAWLDPVRIPLGKDTICGFCETPLEFLMQVYSPVIDKDEAFHRTLFVFICPSMDCLKAYQTEQGQQTSARTRRSVRVFRSQLPRANPYYSASPPRSDGQDAPTSDGIGLCSWCGTWKADKVCARCQQVRYCSRAHQRLHWRGGHSSSCQEAKHLKTSDSADVKRAEQPEERKVNAHVTVTANGRNSADKKQGAQEFSTGIALAASTKLWPEFELVVDVEPPEEVFGDGDGAAQSKEQSAYLEYMRKVGEGLSSTDVRGVEYAPKDQQQWAAFQARLARAPEQVLRYCRSEGAKPLWPRLDNQLLDSDIPPCSSCGGPRTFEFQILSQLLYFLGVENEANSLDWETIAVYTCAASCQMSVGSGTCSAYQEEVAWVQVV